MVNGDFLFSSNPGNGNDFLEAQCLPVLQAPSLIPRPAQFAGTWQKAAGACTASDEMLVVVVGGGDEADKCHV